MSHFAFREFESGTPDTPDLFRCEERKISAGLDRLTAPGLSDARRSRLAQALGVRSAEYSRKAKEFASSPKNFAALK